MILNQIHWIAAGAANIWRRNHRIQVNWLESKIGPLSNVYFWRWFVGVQVWHVGASVHLLVSVRCYLTSWSIVSSRWYCKSSCSSSGSSRKPSRFRRKWVERNRKSLWSLQCLMIWSTTGWCVCVWVPIRCLPIRVIHFSSSLAFCARWVPNKWSTKTLMKEN